MNLVRKAIQYDKCYDLLSQLRKTENALLITSLIYPIFINSFRNNLSDLHLTILESLSIVFPLLYSSLSLYLNFIIFPNCENQRMLAILDNAMGTRHQNYEVDKEYFNPEIKTGFYKLVMNYFESCLYSEKVSKGMILRKVYKNLSFVCIFSIIIYLESSNPTSFRRAILTSMQIFISAFLLFDLFKLYNFNKKLKTIYNEFEMALSQQENYDVFFVNSLKAIIAYENSLSLHTISLDAKVYKRLRDIIEENWQEVKAKFASNIQI